MITASHVHQGRFGFHPCDYATFLKLKLLNKRYVEAQHQKASYNRWERKAPHNRVTRKKVYNGHNLVSYEAPVPRPEPVFNGLLEKETYYSPQDRNGQYVKQSIERSRLDWVHQAQWIPECYKLARMPNPTPESIKQLKLSDKDIEMLLSLVS